MHWGVKSEKPCTCTFLFSSYRCTVKCILNAGRNTKKGCHGDKICQGKHHAILKMNKSIHAIAISFFQSDSKAFVALVVVNTKLKLKMRQNVLCTT